MQTLHHTNVILPQNTIYVYMQMFKLILYVNYDYPLRRLLPVLCSKICTHITNAFYKQFSCIIWAQPIVFCGQLSGRFFSNKIILNGCGHK